MVPMNLNDVGNFADMAVGSFSFILPTGEKFTAVPNIDKTIWAAMPAELVMKLQNAGKAHYN